MATSAILNHAVSSQECDLSKFYSGYDYFRVKLVGIYIVLIPVLPHCGKSGKIV